MFQSFSNLALYTYMFLYCAYKVHTSTPAKYRAVHTYIHTLLSMYSGRYHSTRVVRSEAEDPGVPVAKAEGKRKKYIYMRRDLQYVQVD